MPKWRIWAWFRLLAYGGERWEMGSIIAGGGEVAVFGEQTDKNILSPNDTSTWFGPMIDGVRNLDSSTYLYTWELYPQ